MNSLLLLLLLPFLLAFFGFIVFFDNIDAVADYAASPPGLYLWGSKFIEQVQNPEFKMLPRYTVEKQYI